MSDEIPLSDAEKAFFEAMNEGDNEHREMGAKELVGEEFQEPNGSDGQSEGEPEEGEEVMENMEKTASSPVRSAGEQDGSSAAVLTADAGGATGVPNVSSIPPIQVPASVSGEPTQPSTPVTAQPSKPGSPAIKQEATTFSTSDSNATKTTGKRKRLPQDVVGQFEDRIAEDPKGDIDAWLGLIEEYKRKGKFDDARSVYERFLAVFPTAAHQWIAYIQMELDNNELMRVERIFSSCLLSVFNVELWSLYLDYIRRRNNLTNDPTGKARGIINQAYDFVLNNVGHDRESGRIWQDYIAFIKSAPGTIGGAGGWEGQQKMDSLRKAYQRAITLPVEGVERMWKEYDSFEQGLNKMTARKFLQERSAAFMTARSSSIELGNLIRGLRRETIPRLPPAHGCDGEDEFNFQVQLWKKWIKWERDDPLVISQEDPPQFRNRVLYVYRQALMAMRFCPEFWYDTAEYCFENGMDDQGINFLRDGIIANPESPLLTFKYAERLEASSVGGDEGDNAAIRRGQIVRKPYDDLLNALYSLYAKYQAREKEDLEKLDEELADSKGSGIQSEDDDSDSSDDEDDSDVPTKKISEKERRLNEVKNHARTELLKLSKIISAVWINLMRAMRRIQGHGKVNDALGGSRQIFADARKRGKITADVYIASALIEYHCYRDPAALRIFERGMKLFPDDEDFALEYLKHLVNINDITNARALFSTFVNRVPEKSQRIYAYFHAYESQYGDLLQIQKLEAKMKELYPSSPLPSTSSPSYVIFATRHAVSSTDPFSYLPILSRNQLRPKEAPKPVAQPPEQPAPRGYSPPPMHSTTTIRYVSPPPQPSVSSRIASPKRPAPDHEDDRSERAHKIQRSDSPILKGAAGRRLNQLKQKAKLAAAAAAAAGGGGGGGPGVGGFDRDRPVSSSGGRERDGEMHSLPPPPPLPVQRQQSLPDAIMYLLSILPPAESYQAVKFKPEAMVGLLQGLNVPNHPQYGA